MRLTGVLQGLGRRFCLDNRQYAEKFFNVIDWKSNDKAWRKKRLMQLTAAFAGRRRNCKRVSVVAQVATMKAEHKQRLRAERDLKMLDFQRLKAATNELDFDIFHLQSSLVKSHVHLDRGILSDLAIWEPRTFRSIVGIAAHHLKQPAFRPGVEQRAEAYGYEIEQGPDDFEMLAPKDKLY